MPGPGGGGFGGGGGRGGGFGGGRGGGGFGGGGRGGGFGGGFGGGHRPPPRGPYFGGPWHRGPRRYGYGYGGGGCLGGLLSMILLPVILLMFAVILLMSTLGSGLSSLVSGGDVLYNEEVLQDYANEQYAYEFQDSKAYEDHILLVVLTSEDHYEYNFIAWVGDHVAPQVNHLFGNNQTPLGQTMNGSISENYKYSLDTNLADVVRTMTDKVTALGLESSFTCGEDPQAITSHLTNRTDLPLTEDTVNSALTAFTEATGITMVIVVEDMEAVYGRIMTGDAIFTLVISVALIAVAVWLIYKAVKKRREGETN